MLCLAPTSYGQQQQFHNFTINDGLASNKIYGIIEDRYGFIWVATDQGVSRYDGVSFLTFTTRNGLTDNEVLGLFEDSSGRIWFKGFSHEPCYYYGGIIYNSGNDALLKRISEHRPPSGYMDVIIQKNRSIAFSIEENGQAMLVGKDIQPITISKQMVHAGNLVQHILFENSSGYQLVSYLHWNQWQPGAPVKAEVIQSGIYRLNYSTIPVHFLLKFNVSAQTIWKTDLATGHTISINMASRYEDLFVDETAISLVTANSYTIFDTSFQKITEQATVPFSFTRLYVDRNGNKWFGSFDRGIYFIRRSAPLKYAMPGGTDNGILHIQALADNLFICTEKNGLFKLDTSGRVKPVFSTPEGNRIKCLSFTGNYFLAGTDEGLYRTDKTFARKELLLRSSIKDLEPGENGEILIGTGSMAYSYQRDSLSVIDNTRTQAVFRKNDHEVWLGGLKGLRRIVFREGKYVSETLKLHPVLDHSRIADIKRDQEGNLWVATTQEGLFYCWDKGEVIHFSEASGEYRLQSDLCYEIFIHPDGSIWLSGVGGVSVIEKKQGRFLVRNYSIPESMPGKTISSLAIWKNRVMLATPDGLYGFDRFPVLLQQTAETVITGIKVNDSTLEKMGPTLRYDQNNLIINYAASFINTGANYLFRYRVKELNPDWIETNTLQVPLLGLEPGAYTFEIASVNSHGIAGKIQTIQFEIGLPWFRQWWFILIVCLIGITTGGYYYKLARDKINLGRNLTLFKLRILRAQMNPHFVFNALSNVQRLVQVKALENAEEYLGTLASIMRKGMEYSGQEFILLRQELDYTRNYLEIEKLRFEEKFDYTFLVNVTDADLDGIYVPPLLLQPLVENSIKHGFKGIFHKGKITVSIQITGSKTVKYQVSDNGRGFDVSQVGLKNHGLGISRERLEILYKSMHKKGTFLVSSGPEGTIITIELPVLKD